MLRRSASVVLGLGLAFAALATGCSKKDDAKDTSTTGAAAKAAGPAASGAVGGKAVVNWEKVERVPFAKLQTTLADPILPGFKRTEQGGQTVPDGESTYSEATATFTGPNEASIHFTVQDHPIHARDLISSKTTSFKTYPVVLERESTDDSEFKIVVGDRFIVHATASHLKAAQLKAAFEKVDLAKLASWKLEGVK